MRRWTVSLAGVVALSVAVCAAWAQAADRGGKAAPTDDLKLIQGTWDCVVTLMDGKQVQNYVGVRAIIQGKSLTWVFPQPGGKQTVQKAVFTIDPSQNPKHMDWYPEAKPDDVHRRLYVLEGDVLLMSTNLRVQVPREGVRPESFSAGQWLFVCKRVQQN